MKPPAATADAYLDHYERFMRGHIAGQKFEGYTVASTIQVLAYEKVFPECMVFATLGLSLSAAAIGGIVEVVVPVDDGLPVVPKIVANALFYAIEQEMKLSPGMVVGGIRNIAPKFALAFGKTALYFTGCRGFPPEFARVPIAGHSDGKVLMGMFISAPEEALLRAEGPDALETKFEELSVDPFALRRHSLV